MLAAGEIDIVTFTSSSTVANLMATLGNSKAVLKGVTIACIGPKTMESALKAGIKVDIVATEQTIKGLVESIKQYFLEVKK